VPQPSEGLATRQRVRVQALAQVRLQAHVVMIDRKVP
jgi:hypothetical protein